MPIRERRPAGPGLLLMLVAVLLVGGTYYATGGPAAESWRAYWNSSSTNTKILLALGAVISAFGYNLLIRSLTGSHRNR